MSLILTGASGQLGRQTAELLLQQVSPETVRLVTRNPDSLEDLAARGAHVRFGDFDQPSTLEPSFAGGSRLLLTSTTALDRRETQHLTAIRAAIAAGVRHVIYTSVVGADPRNPAVIVPSHLATEAALRKSGLTWTFLRNSLYAEYQVAEAAHSLETGTLIHNRGEGQVAFVSRDDCAAVAAAVLAERDGHQNAIYDITGPELFNATRLAEVYRQVDGRNVDSIDVDDETLVAGLVGSAEGDGHSAFGAQLVASFGRATREGWFACCSNAVAQLTGRPPIRLRDVLVAHRDEL